MFARLTKILSEKDWRRLLIFSGWVFFYEILIGFFVIIGQYPFINGKIFKIAPQLLLVRWDSWLFLDVVQNGYTAGLAKLFPLFPFAVKFFDFIFGNVLLAGFLVSWLALVLALFFFWKLLSLEEGEATRRKALLFLLFSPAAIFFSLIYSEALFLFFTVAFFYFLKKDRWLPAALCGFGAALTRHIGIFLFFIFLLHYWEVFRSLPFRPGKIFSKKTKVFLLSFLIPLATFFYAAFCRWKFGHWLAFAGGELGYDDCAFGWPWETAVKYFQLIFSSTVLSDPYYFFRSVVVEAGSFLLCLVAAIYFFIRRENLYGWFCFLNIAIPAAMFPMVSVNRYTAVVFPVYIFLARLAKRETVFDFLLVVSAVLFFGNILALSRGWWIG